MSFKTLDILIPTYNRSAFLEKNIIKLIEIIDELDLKHQVTILVSNNKSTDDTKNMLLKYSGHVNSYHQDTNIGLEKNALFCLSQSKKDFVMYLGDDDFISNDYLQRVIEVIGLEEDLKLITPSFCDIDLEGQIMNGGGGRDLGFPERKFYSGLESAKYFCFRGHQLSGQVLKRSGLVEAYSNDAVNNLYPFIYFATKTALDGVSFHCPQFPVNVTQPGQKNKDWGYGADGLLDEIFNNFKCMSGISYKDRFSLEQAVLENQSWRYFSSIKSKPFKFVASVIKSQNTSLATKFCYLFIIPRVVIKKAFVKILRKLNA